MLEAYTFHSNLSDKFPYSKARDLFEGLKHNWESKINFEEFIKGFSGFVFAGFYQGSFKGVLYYHDFEEESCYMSGFAKPKNAIYVTQAIKIVNQMIINTYDIKKIFTLPKSRAAKICDLRSGFKPYKDNILIYKKGL